MKLKRLLYNVSKHAQKFMIISNQNWQIQNVAIPIFIRFQSIKIQCISRSIYHIMNRIRKWLNFNLFSREWEPSIFESQRVSCVTSARRIPINYNGWWARISGWLVAIAINSAGLNDIAACSFWLIRIKVIRIQLIAATSAALLLGFRLLKWLRVFRTIGNSAIVKVRGWSEIIRHYLSFLFKKSQELSVLCLKNYKFFKTTFKV